ncbi:MAG: helix-turn-helix domain-containing protein [Methanoregula sp.]|uniref:helix-turn-helix domain-containing protein n=1 Tax=Methanoregula sp. TaxID=2052170 RepID=UPI0025E449BD|nr:helix-turn-helix domain-containing protein [Methanoregula sp.]MCK9631299.1 helix-turn-helix domain-containing protein [Methanoregula sp.]
MVDDTQMLTPRQVAEILGVHQKTVHLWLRSGRLQGTKISYRAWRIPKTALDSFIVSNSNTRLTQHTDSLKKSAGEPNNAQQLAKQKEKHTQNPIILDSSPQARMKHYIQEIMGEKNPK